jgi:hypothetical protein
VNLAAKLRAAMNRHSGLSLSEGQLVLDSISGFTGTVLSGHAEHRVRTPGGHTQLGTVEGLASLPGLALVEQYDVQLSDGTLRQRSRDQLVPLPPGVGRDLELLEP